MRQREKARQIVCKTRDCIGQCQLWALPQVVGLSMTADQQGQSNIRHCLKQARMPKRRAFRARRQIAVSSFARIAKSSWNDGDAPHIVKLLRRKLHPWA